MVASRIVWLFAVLLLQAGCSSPHAAVEPAITFTELPPYGEGGPGILNDIAGRADGEQPGQKIAVYAKSGIWWIQPIFGQELVSVKSDHTWRSKTHPGWAYAALLVTDRFHPRAKTEVLPERGGAVLALSVSEGLVVPKPAGKTVPFAGYRWQVRETPNNPGDTQSEYDPANAFADPSGFLHLRITGEPAHWRCAEVNLPRGLGYGTYRFIVSDVSRFEPSVVLSIDFHHEMDIELSRWGVPAAENGQFVIQPYNIPANTTGFQAPAGRMTFMLHWEPGRAAFKAFRGITQRAESLVEEHVFTSGVPIPGDDSIHLNLYAFGNDGNPLRKETEVRFEKFEFLP